MAHLQYMPGDPRLVDQLVYELKSKGIFDQFRKDCIADVDTRPAYQNLRQRVENSVSSFLSRQCWKPDLNKNQLREKLRKHILDGNYLEQGVERIVDQVVNPKVASVFIPQVEDLVYNYLGISRKKTVTTAETSNGKISTDDLLPTDLEAVSPGSVKSNDDKSELMDEDIPEENKMEVEDKKDGKNDHNIPELEKDKVEGEQVPTVIELTNDSDMDLDKSMSMHENIKLENIPPPDNSPPKVENEIIVLEKIQLPKEHNMATEAPHPHEIPLPKDDKEQFFKPIVQSDDESSSDSSLRRNMSPLTPIRNYNNENSCDAQQAFENDESDSKSNDKKEPSSFRFAIEAKSPEDGQEAKPEKKDPEQMNLAYQFNNQVNINAFNTPMYEDSSNSNNLQIDYESDVNSKTNTNIEKVPEVEHNSEDKRDKKSEEKKSSSSSHKSSHKSRDSHRHSSSKDKRSESKQSTSRDSSRHDKKSKDDSSKSKSSHREREKSKDRSDKKDSRDSSKHRSSSHKSSSSHRDSKSHRSSTSSSQKHSSDKKSDEKRSSSSHKDKSERSSEKSSDRSSRDKKDSKSSSHRSDKDRKSSSSKSKHGEKDKKKDKKETDDHYSLSGRGNHGRRSTDRDSNDGSSSSKGSQHPSATKPTEAKKDNKGSSSKSDNTSTSGESASPSDKDAVTTASDTRNNQKPIRVENHLEVPIASPPRLPFVPDITLKKPKFAANLEEAKRMMKMRKFLDEEQKRMNQEAALLLEFQANVRPSLSQVYSSIPGPELEFACINNEVSGIFENKVEKSEPVLEEEKVPIKLNTTVPDLKEEKCEVIDIKEIENEIKSDEPSSQAKQEVEDTPPTNDTEMGEEAELKPNADTTESYNENKPFSQLMDEISEYSKASEKNKKDALDNSLDDDNKRRTEYFEVTIITEELSETEELEPEPEFVTEKLPEPKEEIILESIEKLETESTEKLKSEVSKTPVHSEEESLRYFAEHEKFDAELKRHQFSNFLKEYTEKNLVSDKIHVINCDTYEENILKEVCATYGTFEVINYYKNGHLKLPKPAKSVVKDVNVASEITLPVDNIYSSKSSSPVFSPVKSECSFELSSDYDAKLQEMVKKTSRQEVMEIILGNVINEHDNPTIDYCTESSIDNDLHLKRKLEEVESTENNNRHVLTKMRKLSDSDQISSTTEESEEFSNNNRLSNPPRSKYLGRARRVGLSRPRRNNLPNSPSSDKSVENYEQNSQAATPTNGKLKTVTRNKVQRYDTSDLYKPKLHYLSRRNNIS